jgi:hypothetical protein
VPTSGTREAFCFRRMSMCRFTLFAGLLVALFQAGLGAADEPKDKKAELNKAIENADLILVGKVTKTGLGTASSFDVGVIEASKVLKGDAKIKSVRFRFQSSGSGAVAPYGKIGVEGVWLLSGEKAKGAPRAVLSFQPRAEEKAVKALLKAVKKGNDEKAKKDR